MQKTKCFTYGYHSVCFFCSKRCEINFNTLIDYEKKKQYSFLKIDTMLPVSDSLRFRKSLLRSFKNDSS